MQRRMLVVDEAKMVKVPGQGSRIEAVKTFRPALDAWVQAPGDDLKELAIAQRDLSTQIEALRSLLATDRANVALRLWQAGYTQKDAAQMLGVSRTRFNQMVVSVSSVEERVTSDQRRRLD